MLGCALQHFPSASSVLGTITSMEGQDRLSTDGSVLSLWTFSISPVTALSLPGVIKKGISTFTTFPQYLPHIMLWQCLCQNTLHNRIITLCAYSLPNMNSCHCKALAWTTIVLISKPNFVISVFCSFSIIHIQQGFCWYRFFRELLCDTECHRHFNKALVTSYAGNRPQIFLQESLVMLPTTI